MRSDYVIYNFGNDVITIYTTIMYISIVSVVHSSMIQFKTPAHTKVNFTLRAPDLGLGILALFGPWGDFFVCTYFASLSIGRMIRKVFPKETFFPCGSASHTPSLRKVRFN